MIHIMIHILISIMINLMIHLMIYIMNSIMINIMINVMTDIMMNLMTNITKSGHSQPRPPWLPALYFYGYIQIWWEIWQYLWPDLGTWSRLPICPTSGWNSFFGDCRRMSEPGVAKGFEQPFTIKNQNTQIKQKAAVTGKMHTGQKNCPYGFPGICILHIIIYTYKYQLQLQI